MDTVTIPATAGKSPAAEERLTFAELARIEPRLADLLAEARALRRKRLPKNFCANTTFDRRFLWRLERLCGWYAHTDDPRLKTSEAFDTAVAAVYEALPNCKACGCLPCGRC